MVKDIKTAFLLNVPRAIILNARMMPHKKGSSMHTYRIDFHLLVPTRFLGIRPFLVVILVIAITSPAASAHPDSSSPKDANREIAASAISSGVALSRGLEPELRGVLLKSAADAAAAGDLRDEAIKYYNLAFKTTEEMPLLDPFNLRMGLQEGIVAALAQIDLDRATELIFEVDQPKWTGAPEEDPRTRSASVITHGLIQRRRSDDIENIERLFGFLGATGQYPYSAVTELMRYLHTGGKDAAARAAFLDALSHFKRDDQFQSSITAFSNLLVATHADLPGSDVAAGIRATVTKARKLESEQKDDSTRPHLFVSTPHAKIAIRNSSTFVALKLASIAQQVDLDLFSELKRDDPILGGALESFPPEMAPELEHARLIQVYGDSYGGMQKVDQKIRDTEALSTISRAKDIDSQALSTTNIKDPGIRSQAEAQIAMRSSKLTADDRASLLASAEADAEKAGEDAVKATSLLAIARAWMELHNPARAATLLDKTYSLVESMVEEQKKHQDTEENILIGPAGRLCQQAAFVDAALSLSGAVNRVNSLKLPVAMKAFLLIEIGRFGLAATDAATKTWFKD